MAPKRRETTTLTTKKALEKGEALMPKNRKATILKKTKAISIIVILVAHLIANEPIVEQDPPTAEPNPSTQAEIPKPK